MNNCCLKYIPLFVITFLLSGCGLFGEVFKSDDYVKQKISSEEKKRMREWISDRSTLTIREQADTVMVIPEKIIKQGIYFSVDSLVDGLMLIQNDLLDVRLISQPKTGMLSASAILKSHSVPVKFNKETILQNDVRTETTEAVSVKKSSKQAHSHSTVEKGSVNSWYYIFGIGILIIMGSFFLFYWLKKHNL